MKTIDKKMEELQEVQEVEKATMEELEKVLKELNKLSLKRDQLQKEILELSRTELLSTPEELEKEREKETRSFVMSFMNYSGENRELLSEDDWTKAYLLCDGYGKIDEEFAASQAFDWSHVRDSSPEALKEVEKFIRSTNTFRTFFKEKTQ